MEKLSSEIQSAIAKIEEEFVGLAKSISETEVKFKGVLIPIENGSIDNEFAQENLLSPLGEKLFDIAGCLKTLNDKVIMLNDRCRL